MSLPDDLVDKISGRLAAKDRSTRTWLRHSRTTRSESPDELLAAWRAESPVPNDVQQWVETELNDVG